MAIWISRPVLRRFGLGTLVPDGAGRIELERLQDLRRLASELGRPRADGPAPRPVSAGELLVLSLLEEEIRKRLGAAEIDWAGALESLTARFGRRPVEEALEHFADAFAARREGEWRGPADLRELVTVWSLERHPAAGSLAALLHEGRPEPSPLFEALAAGSSAAEGLTALRELMVELAAEPGTLSAAVGRRRERTARTTAVEPAELLLAADVLAEEQRVPFLPPAGGAAGPEPEEPRDWEPTTGPPRFGMDPSWAKDLVLLAKQLPVWLQQLGVERIDEIPDDELARLAGRGFNGLWLVGLWERSRASRWIKQLCGNPEAEASAYSIAEYEVAQALGGPAALDRLRERAASHGIRLAADMVPNHTGLDSSWVLDHPERFVSLPEPPFPSYTFSGPDLSPRPETVGLYLEDHYYDASDAAVVFERVDRQTGERRYIYHGNDGTGLPWNDTAQLDYRRADVRAAVVDTILRVARRFPVIRFDAAMTLTLKHFRRLWFPRAGEGGAIPSRAGHGVSERQLREAMPREFWTEVVDAVEEGAPDTLLLAEAFWLMEAHFTRGLGVHRVYNSAFVNCLRQRRPAALRRQLGEVLRLDPRVLERQVNYLSNPDEAPVRELFGEGARWRAASLLLATLPGTPLFAHGQVEGFLERYGMEYARAYRNETPDEGMVRWHQAVLAPLLARRSLFAGSSRFRLLELADRAGAAADDVLAFANGVGRQPVVVVANLSSRRVDGVLRLVAGDTEREGQEPWLGRPCRDLVAGSDHGAAPGGEARAVTLAPWQVLVLTDFATAGVPTGNRIPARPPAHPAPAVPALPAPTPALPKQRQAGEVATLGIALATGVAALLGLERLLAAATASGLLLLAMSALGGFVLVLRNNSR